MRKFYSKQNKYRNSKVKHAGYSFGSKLEASVYDLLLLDKVAGVIATIQCQASVYLTEARILFKPDFKVTNVDGKEWFCEAKGFETPVWRIKLRLWRFFGPGELHVYKGSAARPYLDEVVKSKGACA